MAANLTLPMRAAIISADRSKNKLTRAHSAVAYALVRKGYAEYYTSQAPGKSRKGGIYIFLTERGVRYAKMGES